MPPDALPDVNAFFADVACHGRVDGDAVERAVAAFVARHTNLDGERQRERASDRLAATPPLLPPSLSFCLTLHPPTSPSARRLKLVCRCCPGTLRFLPLAKTTR